MAEVGEGYEFDGIVATKRFETPEEFLRELDPALGSELTRESVAEYWVYRGQANADWPLLPSSFRDDAKFWTSDGWKPIGPGAQRTSQAQIAAEAETLRRFFTLADRHGFAVPEDSQQLRRYVTGVAQPSFIDELKGAAGRWAPDIVVPVLGLAQHHGIPTRMLDWTLNPNTAAFFAARDSCRRQARGQPDSELCVWVFFSMFVDKGIGSPLIEVASVPAATNRNLHAQEGLFVIMRSGSDVLGDPADLRPLEKRFEELLPEVRKRFPRTVEFERLFGGLALFLKHVLPSHHAPKLLKLLAARGITAARLFPGLDGVAEAMWDEDLWVKA